MNCIEQEFLPESKSARYASRAAWIPIAGIPLYTFLAFYALYSIGKGKTGLFLLGKGLWRLLWINLASAIILTGWWFCPYQDKKEEYGIRGAGYSMRGFSRTETMRIWHWKFYDPRNKLTTEGDYSFGKKAGKWVSYHPEEGQIFSEGIYQNDKKEGTWRYFYPDGRKNIEIEFVNDKQNGQFIRWHENGQVAEQAFYVNGAKEGLWKTWYKNGSKEQEVKFVNGKEEGLYVHFFDDGNKVEEGQYKEGKRFGTWDIFNADGVKTEVIYDPNGNPADVKQITKDSDP